MYSQHEMNVLDVGQVLGGQWMILEPIAEGGMAEVYRARQLNLNRDVAIKVMSQRWIASFEDDPEGIKTAVQRFRREVQTMAQVRHSNVIQIYDYGRASAQETGRQTPPDYIVMEYLPDGTLRQTMAEGGAYPQQDDAKAWLRDYFLPVLDGVQALHELGIVHRDLKPENILLDHGVPKIADFGLARFNRAIGVTDSGEILGSLLYVSPEQFVDLQNADERSDIYALGRILYEAMCGRITRKVMPMSRVGLPRSHQPFFQRLDRIVRKATAEEKEERPASVQILRRAIERLIEDGELAGTSAGDSRQEKAGPWKSVLRLAAASVIAVAVAAGVYPWQGTNGPRGAPASNTPLRDAPRRDGSPATPVLAGISPCLPQAIARSFGKNETVRDTASKVPPSHSRSRRGHATPRSPSSMSSKPGVPPTIAASTATAFTPTGRRTAPRPRLPVHIERALPLLCTMASCSGVQM